MKFGHQLAEHIRTSSSYSAKVYVPYNALKEKIRHRRELHRAQSILETASFKRALRKTIATVNCFYVRMEADLLRRGADYTTCPQLIAQALDLKLYAMLNYVAVLKLLKKHDKHCETQLYPVVERILAAQPFVHALLCSRLFYADYAPSQEGDDASSALETCAICLEPRSHLQSLACSHAFCMLCLARASAAELHSCPSCRSPQSLHPIDISLGQLNIALKYSPRELALPHQLAEPDVSEAAQPCAPDAAHAKARAAPGARLSTEQLSVAPVLASVAEAEADSASDDSAASPAPRQSGVARGPSDDDAAQTCVAEPVAPAPVPVRALRTAARRCVAAALAVAPSGARARSHDLSRLVFSVVVLALAGMLFAWGNGSSAADGVVTAAAGGCTFASHTHANGVHAAMLGFDGKSSVSAFSPGL